MNDWPVKQPSKGRFRWKLFLLLFLAAILVLAGGVYYLTQDFWSDNLRAYLIGREYVIGQKYGRFLPPVDEIEIFALGGEVPDGTPDSFSPDIGPRLGTVNRRTIRGAEAESLASLWRGINFDRHFGALCHNPFYALRFRHHGKLVLETSICWKCSNVTLPMFGHSVAIDYGFDAKSEDGQKLLSTLTQYAPHPPGSK
jgi:hypothetical protein